MRRFLIFFSITLMACPGLQPHVKKPDDAFSETKQVVEATNARVDAASDQRFVMTRESDNKTWAVNATTTDVPEGLNSTDFFRVILGTPPWDRFHASGEKTQTFWAESGGGYIVSSHVTESVDYETATGMRLELDADTILQRALSANPHGKKLFIFHGMEWDAQGAFWKRFFIQSGDEENTYLVVRETPQN